MTSWIDGLRSRCGPFADAAERFAVAEGVEIDPPRGVHALRALHEAIERHRARGIVEEDVENSFLERDGAFLAAVIADYVGKGPHAGREGRHALVFARYASFDPFAGIERVLNANDSGDALALEVAQAERIAHTSRRPGADDEPWREARERVLPRLIGPSLIREMGEAGEQVFSQRLVGDLQLALILRYPGRARFVRRVERANWPAEACAEAIRNLARTSNRAKLMRADGDEGTFVTARSADGLDAARLLLPGLHDVLAPELGSPFVAAVPHRDALFACDARDRRSTRALAARARLEHDRARHGISAALVLVHPGTRLEALPDPRVSP